MYSIKISMYIYVIHSIIWQMLLTEALKIINIPLPWIFSFILYIICRKYNALPDNLCQVNFLGVTGA